MPGTPHYPRDLGTEVRDLQRQQQIGRTAAQSRVGFDQVAKGSLTVVNDDGQEIAKLGYFGQIDGEPVYGFSLHRADGTEAIRAYSSASGANTFTAILDTHGNFLFSDDGLSGEGIATPHVAYMPPQVSGNAALVPVFWPRTTSTSFVTVLDCYNQVLQPQLRLFAIGWCDASVTGQLRALINGTVIGSANLAANGATSLVSGTGTDVFPIPGWGTDINFQDDMHFELQIRVASGTGNVYAQVFGFGGWQS